MKRLSFTIAPWLVAHPGDESLDPARDDTLLAVVATDAAVLVGESTDPPGAPMAPYPRPLVHFEAVQAYPMAHRFWLLPLRAADAASPDEQMPPTAFAVVAHQQGEPACVLATFPAEQAPAHCLRTRSLDR